VLLYQGSSINISAGVIADSADTLFVSGHFATGHFATGHFASVSGIVNVSGGESQRILGVPVFYNFAKVGRDSSSGF
jgi:hypothetical protein